MAGSIRLLLLLVLVVVVVGKLLNVLLVGVQHLLLLLPRVAHAPCPPSVHTSAVLP